jgi:peptide deformylase
MVKPKLQSVATIPHPFESGTFRAARRAILERPDPSLEERCIPVDPRDRAVVDLAAVLVSTMRASRDCVGLSAPQIGERVRVFCMDVMGLIVLVNPSILKRRGNTIMVEECMSIPDIVADVARASDVLVEGFEPGTGRMIRLATNGLEARCIQHEIDHLDGICFVERTIEASSDPLARRWYV